MGARCLLVVMVFAACEKKTPRYEGPLRVELGDCADDAIWVSGPRPLPLTERVAETKPDKKPDDKVASNDPDEGGEGAFASLTGTGDFSSGFDDKDIYGGLLGNEAGEMNGGFGYGRSGSGPGGGGTGWGTIGTGRYGTIGHGAGTGTGYGVGGGRGGMRGRSANLPTLSIGQPNVQGDLDKAIIRRYIKRNIAKIQYCYEKELLAKPKLAGTVQTQFLIKPDGLVASATATGVDKEVSSCVANVIKGIEFPKPKGGGVQVNFPFIMRSSESSTGPNTTSTAPATAGAGSQEPPAEPPPPPPPAPKKAAEPRAPYRPGATNPLAAELPAIEECLRTNSKPYGAVTVKLGTPVVVRGVSDHVATCIAEVAAKITSAKPQTCSLAFGTMPVAELPAIEITGDAIKFENTFVASAKTELLDESPRFKIDALFDRVEAAVKRDRVLATPVSVTGPLVVRPLDSTPISLVSKVISTIAYAGGDYVLAAEKPLENGKDWRILHQVTPPVVPVPLGTGGSWAYKRSKNRNVVTAEDEHVTLSILVQKDQIWVGLSRVNEFQQIPALASKELDWDKLEAALKAHKATPFFADRTDVEIAGEQVNYIDIVHAIDVANKAQFVDFRLIDPVGLSARPTL